jgi:hypothetical protein
MVTMKAPPGPGIVGVRITTRYRMDTVIGTWMMCDCKAKKCVRMPIFCGRGAKLPLGEPEAVVPALATSGVQ